MLREMGNPRSLHRAPSLVAGHGGLALGRSRDVELIDYIARRRGPGRVMRLSSFRLRGNGRLGASTQRVRHELRLHGLCEELVLDSFSEAEVPHTWWSARPQSLAMKASCARFTNHQRVYRCSLPPSPVTSRRAVRKAALTAALLASSPVPESLFAIIDRHLAKLESERRVLPGSCCVRPRFRIDTLALVLERDALNVADTCDQLLREQVWIVASRAAGSGARRKDRIPFATRSSGRRSTTCSCRRCSPSC